MSPIETVVRAVVFVLGAAFVARTMLAAVRYLLLPRGSNDRLSRLALHGDRRLFDLFAPPRRPFPARDRILAYYAPTSLLVVLVYWLLLIGLGYAAMFWSLGVGSAAAGPATADPSTVDALVASARLSGSSLLTLGFAASDITGVSVLVFSEAVLGLILIALLISYLPTIYGAFSRRELLVNLLEVRADTPPSAVVLLTRFDRLHGLGALHDMWVQWEQWFAEVEETHTSLPALAFYRSQQPGHSWVNAAGAIMDTAAPTRAVLDVPTDARADLCIRAGYLAVRRIARFFGLPYPEHPAQTDPTSVSRAQFDQVCAVLQAAGLPLKPDRDQAWRDFNGWRVNYDAALLGLARLTVAPPSWWERPLTSAYATDEPVAAPLTGQPG